MSLVLPPPPSVEGSLLGRLDHAYTQPYSNQPVHHCGAYIPPHLRQPSSGNQRQNAQAAREITYENQTPHPTTNNHNQHRRSQNVNSTTTAAHITQPRIANPQPINPATGQPISKRAARRRRARARAAEARRQERAGQTIAHAPQIQHPSLVNQHITHAPTKQSQEGSPRPPPPHQVIRACLIGRAIGAPNNWATVRNTSQWQPHPNHSPPASQEIAGGAAPAGPSRGAPDPCNRWSLNEVLRGKYYATGSISRNDSWWSEFNGGFEGDGSYNTDDDNDDLYVSSDPWANEIEEEPNSYVPSDPLSATPPCSICLEVPDEYPTVPPTVNCAHQPSICAACLTQHISHAVLSQGLTTLTCPDPECRQEMEYEDVVRGSRDDQACLDRYKVLLLRRILENEPNFVWCKDPTYGWGQVHKSGDDAPIVICQVCHARSCFTHDVLWHTNLTCEQYTAQAKRAVEEQASEEYVQQHAKVCPNTSCGHRIEKAEGCDHMTCRRPAGCGHEFCWICLVDYEPIRQEGNHRHAASCRYYAPIDAPNPSQTICHWVEEILRVRRDFREQADDLAQALDRPQREPQARVEPRLNAVPPVAVAPVAPVAQIVPLVAQVIPLAPRVTLVVPDAPIPPARPSEVGPIASSILPPVDPEPVQTPTTPVPNSPTNVQVLPIPSAPELPIPIALA